MACLVSRYCGGAEEERKLGLRVKLDIFRQLGECMQCSIGVADNVFLAKVCSEMEKPNGLTILDESNFPQALFQLNLRDLPGIGGKMHARLVKCGIYSVRDLWDASRADLHRAWGGIGGDRWWHMMRGSQKADYESNTREAHKTVGHSHVLPPSFRSVEGARGILLRLLSRALKRLRAYDQAARTVHLQVSFREDGGFGKRKWMITCSLPVATHDDITWFARLRRELGSLALPGPADFPLQGRAPFTAVLFCADGKLCLLCGAQHRA